MKWYYDPATKEPITGVLPASITLPYKVTPPPEVEQGHYVLAGDTEDWIVHSNPVDNSARAAAIEIELKDIDAQSARPMRAILNGTAVGADNEELGRLELLAQALREELATL